MRSHLTVTLFAVLALSACGSSVAQFDIQDRTSGERLDTVFVLNTADHPMTPGLAISGRVNAHGEFEPFDVAAAGSPLEQVMPVLTAGIGAGGAIAAAREMEGDEVNVTGGNAVAEAVNWNYVWQQVSVEQRMRIENCVLPVSIGGLSHFYSSC